MVYSGNKEIKRCIIYINYLHRKFKNDGGVQMSKYDIAIYDDCRKWIQRKSEKGISWDEIELACKKDRKDLIKFLQNREEEDDWPSLTVEEWIELVKECKVYENKQQDILFRGNEGVLFDTKQDNGLRVPENERSCWQLYKNNLKWNSDSIEDLEYATLGILRRLSINTKVTGPIKGLVVGHVQSGKTANMEALMAMAADHGWNMFIVLSGTIENLRIQTLKRMQKDLNQEGNLIWRGVEHPSKRSQYGERAIDLHFEEGAQSRYFTVCLKNTGRLKKLIDWIHADKATHEKMKILIIDDEADQASISNTTNEYKKEVKERKGVNKLIVDLVEDRHYKEDSSVGKATAINYVMYTATPYANFLNEWEEEALYPKHFIWTLRTSNEYIGPKEIFGVLEPNSSDGLDIKREVSKKDIEIIAKLYEETTEELPEPMKDAICWFICCVSIMRYWQYKKPISMLVHTSQKQQHHQLIANGILNWFSTNSKEAIVSRCKSIYEYETKRLPKEAWLKQFKEYGIKDDKILDYPSFEKILNEINNLLEEELNHIKMTDEGDFKYHKGIHLVIDNCSKNGIQNDSDYVRLAYPDPDVKPYPTPAPAFIIVGGSTLARGLTIEGLVSTFFLRASCQADSLMQMGRWFGYRKGYELLPRIWMTKDTINKYRFLSQLEVELRSDLKKYMFTEIRPIDYGPRIKVSPKVSWLRLTSRNHMRNAVPAEMDFSGAKPQTVIFDNNEDIQRENISYVESFLSKLPNNPQVSHDQRAIFWTDINLSTIMEELLINKFHFSNRSRVFNEIDAFCNWIKQVVSEKEIEKWSVIIAGKDKVSSSIIDDSKHWNICGYAVEKVNRSKRKNSDDNSVIDIGALRALKDCVADIPKKYIDEFGKEITKQEHVDAIRKNAGMQDIPLLIIYCIDGKSTVHGNNDLREDLNMGCDLMGLHICVPGDQVSNNFCKKLTINIPEKDEEDRVEEI